MITNFLQNNTGDLDRLLADFHLLTGMKVCVYDADGKELCYYPDRYSGYCGYLRRFDEADTNCRICDREAIDACKRTGKMHVYTCHAGLTECVAPIIIHGGVRGYIVFGQIREERTLFSVKAAGFVDDPIKLWRLYEALPVISRERLEAAAHILEVCAGYDHLKRSLARLDRRMEEELAEYVDSRLTDDLSVETLCRKFALSRRELYAITRKAFDCTPADFVRNRRLDCAAELLRETNLSVSKIAEDSGIGDYNYFSKLFKNRFDISPKGYRKNNKISK